MGAHALLSPSAAKRWLNCTPAPRLEAQVKETTSTFAEEGTLAHAYCALKLKDFLCLPTDGEVEEINSLNEQYHTGEMDEYTDTYKTIVLEKYTEARHTTKDALLLIETKLDFGSYIPNAFGTADAVIIADGLMEVIDFKYGKGVKVDAFKNPQMMIYALGAFDKFSFDYNIQKIRMTIVQPRLANLSEYEISVTDLLEWSDTVLKPKAAIAYKGEGEQVPGEWCQFCKVKNSCKKLAEHCLDIYKTAHDPKLLSPEDIATTILPNIPIIKSWLTDAEDYALKQALDGIAFPGWKIVEGRSVRKITDADGVAVALNKAGYKTDEIYKPSELRTITDLEKLVGKKTFAQLCESYIVKPQGKPTLAPDSDKRPAMNSASDDFKNIDIK